MAKFHALHDLDRDIRQSLLNQFRDFWTHTSTALEGNTLAGKPLKDHQTLAGYEQATS